MHIFKAFSSFADMYNNALDKTAPFGELTTQSMTFTRDMRVYGDKKYPSTELYLFHCVDDMGVRANPSVGFTNTILSLNQWVYDQYRAKTIPTDQNKPTFIGNIEGQFPNFVQVQVGEILEGDQPDARMPDYIQFKLMDGVRQYQCTVWYADSAFNRQYSEFELVVIPPLPNIADLINSKIYVYNKLKELPHNYAINAAQEIRGTNPETALMSLDLVHHDPNDTNATQITTWFAVVWGVAGQDTEALKDGIRDYLAKNSTYTKWPTIYPSLYSENEFAIIPFWDNLGVSESGLKVGLYSSGFKFSRAMELSTTFMPSGYAQSTNIEKFLADNLGGYAATYRTLMFSCVGNPNNKGDIFDLKAIYPDYMAIPTENPDFRRMSQKTQQFSIALTAALDYAREYNPADVIKPNYTRLVRRGIYYLAFEHNGYSFPVLTKYSFEQTLGIKI